MGLVLVLPGLLAEPAAADWGRDGALLPRAPDPERVDWLVKPVARRAGVFQGSGPEELVLDNGLVRRVFRLWPNAATVALDQLSTGESLIRSVRPEAELTLNGRVVPVGGLVGQPVHNYLLPEWLPELQADPGAFQFVGFRTNTLQPRFGWHPRREWMAGEPPQWPPPGVHLVLRFEAPAGLEELRGIVVEVHHEMYDGLPLLAKWLTVHNGSDLPVRLDTFTSEILACVEATSEVEEMLRPRLPNVHVETDFTTVAMSGGSAQRETVHWLPDPTYVTQVNYRLQTPCLLECRPPLGPARTLAPGGRFESFRSWLLYYDGTDQVRQGLALGRMYRTIAPWVTENPLIFHFRSSEPEAVRRAIDQAAEVGFELVILTFGSGFDIENEDLAYADTMRGLAGYARSRGVALGGYSLLASRSIGPEHDVINPATGAPGGFATFGQSPCLGSAWGLDYFRKLYLFFISTGFEVLEHDGSYPGDACASIEHPGHEGYEDSRWRQWEMITRFYRWCRARGIYLNVPDWYFLHGASKTGMGYRETNWSLPREHQEIIERQNIMDGTRFKTPSMGWMFVPLTEYHGGGAAATIEPLHEHREHYGRRLANLLGAGVQACYRGPRLYDTEETRDLVKHWVSWYKEHRAILDSDLIPLRRADGRDWDGWLHVNPRLETPAMAMLYNPLPEALDRAIQLPLYYSGLEEAAEVKVGSGDWRPVRLDRLGRIEVTVEIPARGHLPVWVRGHED